jgi:hypothetical protein
MKISNVNLTGSGDKLLLEVIALAPTEGYTDVALCPVVYVTPPVDGVQEIRLEYTAPSKPAADVLVPFPLSIHLPVADWFQGVRVQNAHTPEGRSLRNPTIGKKPVGRNGFSTVPIGFEGDKLLIHVRYGGGCQLHSFQLNWDGDILKSVPPKVVLELTHNDNGDTCMALWDETLQFDLSTMAGFPQEEMVIVLQSFGRSFELPYRPVAFESREAAAVDGGGGVKNG